MISVKQICYAGKLSLTLIKTASLALADLGTTVQAEWNQIPHITKVKELRWLLFRKKQAESERLPPILAALKEAIKRAHQQCMVWNNDIVPNPELPSPSNYGWKLETASARCRAPSSQVWLFKGEMLNEPIANVARPGLPCTDLCSLYGTMKETSPAILQLRRKRRWAASLIDEEEELRC
ncbi:hypothetical protein OS493_033088 [Desmophyllum pertusum]|uniref:Uncharacterized protein n=1 Tax=Desmophyllum pertusum TaxID=174260 RepID=A0A9W9Z825_9CNID|nr:hypothetical protein OS493_033088 [Desmophyllum pertusum]